MAFYVLTCKVAFWGLNRSPKKLHWLQGFQFVKLDVLGRQPSGPGLVQIWRLCSLQESQTQDTTNETTSFPHSRPTLHIWCKAWVPTNRITYFLVPMFLANQCVDLKLHSRMSRRGDEEQGQILQFCNLLHTHLVLARTAGSKDYIAHLLQYHSRQRVCKTCLILLKIFWSQFVWSNLPFNTTPNKQVFMKHLDTKILICYQSTRVCNKGVKGDTSSNSHILWRSP